MTTAAESVEPWQAPEQALLDRDGESTGSPASRALYVCVLAYVTAVYLRPGEVLPEAMQLPYVQVLAVLGALTAIVSLASGDRMPLFDRPGDGYVVGFAAALFLSNAASGWIGGAISGIGNFFPVIFCYSLMRIAIRTDRRVTGVVRLLACLTLVQAANGIVEHFTGTGLGGVTPLEDGRIRGAGIFNDPNDLALALVLGMPLFFPAVVGPGRRRITRFIAGGAIAAIISAIFYTNSRGGVLGLGMIVLVYFYSRFGKVLATLVGISAVGLLLMAGPSRMGEMDSGEDSAQGRIEAWTEGLEMLKARPIFGVGFGRFTDYHELVAHNSLVHVNAELGLFGGFWFVGMLYWYFRGLRSPRDATSPEGWQRELRVVGLGVITCLSFLSRQYNIVLFIVLALGTCCASVAESRVRATQTDEEAPDIAYEPRHVVAISAWLLAGLVAIKLAVVLFRA